MERLKLKEKLAYGCGDFGISLIAMLINFYLLTFLTDVVGITPLAAGNVIVFSKIWDAINDPMCGAISAKTKISKKFGKYKLWMLCSAAPYIISIIALFCIPSSMSNAAKIVMMIVFYNLWGMSATAYQIPYGATSTLMTNDLNERASLGIWREWGAKISGLIVSTFGSYIIMYFGGGELSSQGYTRCAIFLGVIAFVAILIPVFGTKERHVDAGVDAVPLKDSIKYLVGGGKHTVMIILVNLLTTSVPVFISSFTVYYCINYLGNPMVISPCMSASMLTPIGAMLLLPLCLKKLGRKWTLFFSNIILILGGVVSLFAHQNIVWVIVSFAIKGFAGGFGGSITLSMIGDTTYFCQKKTGINAPSALYSMFTFSLKLAQAGVTWIAALILTLIGYVGTAPVQTAATVNGLYLANGWLCIVIGAIGIVLSMFYTLDQEMAAEHGAAKA